MTGPLQGLQPYRTDVVGKTARVSYWCELAQKIPGNLGECPLDVQEDISEMKVLSVRQPWASLIAEGHKVIDIRTTNCSYRGPVAIYATRGRISRRNKRYFRNVLGRNVSGLPYGRILCVVDITGTILLDNPVKYEAYQECHYGSMFAFTKPVWGWIFQNIRPLSAEVGFKMPKGCVNWSKIRNSVLDPYLPAAEEVTV